MNEPVVDATAAVPQPAIVDDPTSVTEVLLVRHARSADVVPGTAEAEDPVLHADAAAQTVAVARRLAPKRIDAVYTSRLRRAVLTAEAIALPHGLPVAIEDDLEEVLLGEWSGGEFRRRAAARDPEWLAWVRTGRWDGIPGCEGDAALRLRLRRTVDRLAAAHVGGTIVVVSHGGAINAYLADVLGIERSLWLTVENTSITVVRVGPDGPYVIVANDCTHLYDPVLGLDGGRGATGDRSGRG
jgi:broad specificity phosphatase PhoE